MALEDKNYADFWTHCIIIHVIATSTYCAIFWGLYIWNYYKPKPVSPKDRLLISTNTISNIHCFLVIIGAITSFFYDELYLTANMILTSPGMLAYVYVLWNSYMLADLASHLILYTQFAKSIIKRRYDIIGHHFVSYIFCPIVMIPVPIYGWFLFIWPCITEVSSIFLNFQWFAKYLNWNPKTKKMLKICFLISWFLVRLPAIWTTMVYAALFWNDIILWPKHAYITALSVGISINLLHVIWTVLIVKGLCTKNESKVNPNHSISMISNEMKKKPPKHVHGVSLTFEDIQVTAVNNRTATLENEPVMDKI